MKGGNGKALILTPKQRRFVEELPAVDWNGTQAAINAGYSEKTARYIASENLTKPHIQQAIGKELDRLTKVTGVTSEKVMRELGCIALSKMSDYMHWGSGGVRLVDSDTLTPEEVAAVREVSESTTQHGGTISLKLHDKVGPLVKLGQEYGMFKHEVELSGSIEFDVTAVADKLAGELAGIAARQRARSVAGEIDG